MSNLVSTAGHTGDVDKGRLSERWKVTSARVCLCLMWQVPHPVHSGSECILDRSVLGGPAGGPADKDQPFLTEAESELALPCPGARSDTAAEPLSARASHENSGKVPFFELKNLEG